MASEGTRARTRSIRRRDDARDASFAQRLLLALAFSIALHEIAAGLWPRARQPAMQERVVTQVVSIVVRRTPAPTPRPTVRPTPRITPAPHYTLAPKIVVRAPAPKAAATPHRRLGGAAARRHVVPVQHRPVPATAVPVSLVAGTHAGQQNGGEGTGAGAGAGDGGANGTGTGTGGKGTGTGGDTNSAPCGDVFILPARVDYRPDGTVLQYALAKIVLRDGEVDVAKFPYPFVYPREADNPFTHDTNLSKSGGVAVQTPPPGFDPATMPPAVQVVLKHTNPVTGATDLPDCTPP